MATLQLYGKFAANILGGEAEADAFAIDYLTDDIRATLHTTTYVPAVDTDETFSNATNELPTANGYTAGGQALGTKTVVYTAAGGISTFSAADFSWTAAGGTLTFRYVVIRKNTGVAGTSPLIGYIDCGAQSIADTNTFTVDIQAGGLFTGTVSGA